MAYTAGTKFGGTKKTFYKKDTGSKDSSNVITMVVTQLYAQKPHEKNGTSQCVVGTVDGKKSLLYLQGHTNLEEIGGTLTITPAKDGSGVFRNQEGKLYALPGAKVDYVLSTGGFSTQDTTGKPSERDNFSQSFNSTLSTDKVEASEARENNRESAEKSVEANLESAVRLSKKMKLTGVDVVALADLIGRTISAITISQQRSR